MLMHNSVYLIYMPICLHSYVVICFLFYYTERSVGIVSPTASGKSQLLYVLTVIVNKSEFLPRFTILTICC